MPRPFATKSGSYYLNVRVPNELRAAARGRAVTLPIADESVTVSDKVYVSQQAAKERFQAVLGRLAASWDALRIAPLALKPAEVKALASERRERSWPGSCQ